jgi:multidrug resistance protein MdtO
LGESINSKLDKVRALADGVLFEFGASREQDLAYRDRIRKWQPTLRMLFITRIALWKYRVRLPGFELPEAIEMAQEQFDKRLATALDGMADRMESGTTSPTDDLTHAYAQLEQSAAKTSLAEQQQLTPKVQSFLLLSHRIAGLADCLEKEI